MSCLSPALLIPLSFRTSALGKKRRSANRKLESVQTLIHSSTLQIKRQICRAELITSDILLTWHHHSPEIARSVISHLWQGILEVWAEQPLLRLGHRGNSQGYTSHWGLEQRCAPHLHQRTPWLKSWTGIHVRDQRKKKTLLRYAVETWQLHQDSCYICLLKDKAGDILHCLSTMCMKIKFPPKTYVTLLKF